MFYCALPPWQGEAGEFNGSRRVRAGLSRSHTGKVTGNSRHINIQKTPIRQNMEVSLSFYLPSQTEVLNTCMFSCVFSFLTLIRPVAVSKILPWERIITKMKSSLLSRFSALYKNIETYHQIASHLSLPPDLWPWQWWCDHWLCGSPLGSVLHKPEARPPGLGSPGGLGAGGQQRGEDLSAEPRTCGESPQETTQLCFGEREAAMNTER